MSLSRICLLVLFFLHSFHHVLAQSSVSSSVSFSTPQSSRINTLSVSQTSQSSTFRPTASLQSTKAIPSPVISVISSPLPPRPNPNPGGVPIGTRPPPPPGHGEGRHRRKRNHTSPFIVFVIIVASLVVLVLACLTLRALISYYRTPQRDRVSLFISRHRMQREMAESAREERRNHRWWRGSIVEPPPPPYLPPPPKYATEEEERPLNPGHHSASLSLSAPAASWHTSQPSLSLSYASSQREIDSDIETPLRSAFIVRERSDSGPVNLHHPTHHHSDSEDDDDTRGAFRRSGAHSTAYHPLAAVDEHQDVPPPPPPPRTAGS